MKNIARTGEIYIVNDFSTQTPPKFNSLSNIKSINILNLKKNVGSQKAISIGLKHLETFKKDMIITILDSDGEDDTEKIPAMIELAERENDKVIVSTRTKRHENQLFKLLYPVHKLLTFIFTLQWISFGNFSSFSSIQLKNILRNNSSWLAFSASVAKNCKLIKIKAERKKRIDGVSKLSFYGLILHSLRVNAVFFYRAFVLSVFYTFLILYIGIGLNLKIFILVFIILFNSLLLLTLLLNNQKEFKSSINLIKS